MILEPKHYNADTIDCKTFFVTERDSDGYFTLIWDFNELPSDVQAIVTKAIRQGKTYLNDVRGGDFVEISWD